MPFHWNRRQFLRQVAATGTAATLAALPSRAKPQSAGEKLRIAVVGVGGRGAANLAGVAEEHIVALCDVDQRRAAKSFDQFPQAKKYSDFRKMLDEIHGRIDAVVVSTPDHTHAPAAAMALSLGKHCYCEKPLTHSVAECRALTELAREKKVATQLGTQIHASDNYRRTVELVRSGAIGPVREVYVWHPGTRGGMDRPAETPPVPEGLAWDLWLGPAPSRPYHPCYVPGDWRSWWDFGNGTLGDFGCHYMDLPFWALELKYPTTVSAEGPSPHPETTAPELTVRYEFPERESMPAVSLTWHNGKKRPAELDEKKVPDWRAGVLFIGEKGMLAADYRRSVLLPEQQFADFQPPEPSIPPSAGHHLEWIEACKTGSPTTCNFDYSGPLAEAVLLGNVAYRVGTKLEWDPIALQARNCPGADRYLKRDYREGWPIL